MGASGRGRRVMYGVVLFFITLSGFAQMPIFKRYYIADLPGLGWLAEFYVTHLIHYISAAVLIGLAVFAALDHLLVRKGWRLTLNGKIKAAMILALVASGGLLVVKNLPGVYFRPLSVILLDLAHLSFCMVLLVYSLITALTRKKWVVQK